MVISSVLDSSSSTLLLTRVDKNDTFSLSFVKNDDNERRYHYIFPTTTLQYY